MTAAVACALALLVAPALPGLQDAPSPDPAATATPAPASTAGEAEPVRLLILDLQAETANKAAAELLSSLLAEMASQAQGIEVNTSNDLRRLMALEAEKAALGCEAESCLGEIAGAFGVPYIVFGKLTTLGPVTTLSLSLFDAEAARPIWRKNLRAPDAVELQYELAAGAQELLDVLAKRQPLIVVGTVKGPDRIGAAPAPADPAAPAVDGAAEEGGLPWLLISGGAVAGLGAVGVLALSGTALVLSEVVLPIKDGGLRTVAYYGGFAAIAGAVVAGLVTVGGVALASASFALE
jgi:hypothetical protein